MSISKYPSKLTLPQSKDSTTTVLDYLIERFPDISSTIWQKRMAEGKVHWHDGSLITLDSAYQSQQRVYYYREIEKEPVVPGNEQIIFQDEHILVAHKPHFLPVTPGGDYINECLQNRLRRTTGIETLQASHRLDRVTAGLVLFSIQPESRHLYHQLFSTHKIEKTYLAVANVDSDVQITGRQWVIKNRIEHSEPRFLMKIVEGKANSHSNICCVQQTVNRALFELKPVTGKTHQLRLHMSSIGHPILNDRYYPFLQPKTDDNFSHPLQLLAKTLSFKDPVTHQRRDFRSSAELTLI